LIAAVNAASASLLACTAPTYHRAETPDFLLAFANIFGFFLVFSPPGAAPPVPANSGRDWPGDGALDLARKRLPAAEA